MADEDELLETISAAEDGVYEIIHGAAAVVGELTSDVLYVLDLESSDEHCSLGIEASFGMQQGRRVITRLGVLARDSTPASAVDEALLRDAVERFGGAGYVDLCVVPAGDPSRELDVSASASGPFGWLTELVLLAPEAEGEPLRAAYRDVLRSLGLEPRERGSRLSLPRRRLSPPPDARQQALAFVTARRHGLSATLYSAVIPAIHALRVAESSSESLWYVGRGLSGGQPCTEADVRDVQRFVEERTGLSFGQRQWSIRATPADAAPARETRQRRGVRFTFWVKGDR
jgi:hypothetical protein